MTEHDKNLWARVCATVRKLGEKTFPKGAERPPPYPPENLDDGVIDLHGLSVNDAFHRVMDYLSETRMTHVLVITGRSGIIRHEFPMWMDTTGYFYKEMNGGGAFQVVNKKRAARNGHWT